MTHEAQLDWERRNGRLAAVAALVSILFLAAGTIYRLAAVKPADTDRELLRIVHDEGSDFVISSVLQGLSLVALSFVLYYLYKAIRYRRKELLTLALYVSVLGPLLLAVGAVLLQLDRIDAADDFVGEMFRNTGQAEERAEDLLREVSVASQVAGGAGQLSTALAFVLLGLNGLRSGILSRFLGIIGVIIGALYVLPLVPGGQLVLQTFWLGALVAVFLDRFPGGRGPAWETGEADPWPTAAERRGLIPPPEPELDPEAEPEPEPATRHPRSKKKKRKRR